MSCRSIIYTPLYTFVLFVSVFVSSATGADFSVLPLKNTQDIAIYEATGNYDAEMPDGPINVIACQQITQEFYRTHPERSK